MDFIGIVGGVFVVGFDYDGILVVLCGGICVMI